MKKLATATIIILGIAIACKTTQNNQNKLNLIFTSKSESKVTGTASFTDKNGKVTLLAKLNGLSPGIHAIHIHEKSDCSSPDATSAGGHWNPTFKKHGKWGTTEYHKGDIGNFTADENGNATIKFTTDEWCITCNDQTKNIMGKSLIVHKGSDDFTSQPTGNAGARQACSAIIN